ncbi:hypothetical protein B0J14DRAFT_663908 [Halenospora varia]|nr:hypothetical protein B0J14DRAFT_663908 [Halenospora varia]
MPERRHAQSGTSRESHRSTQGIRRNLFQATLSRRPTTSSTSTSAETLRLDIDHESDTSDIVIRDKNGEFEIGDPPMQSFDEQEEGGVEMRMRMRRLADAVKHHQRDRNRAPSEPAELLEAVKTSLRTKVAALAEDNWMYEAEEEPTIR